MIHSGNVISQIPHALAFPKCGLSFFVVSIYYQSIEIVKAQKRQTTSWKRQD